MKRLCFVSIFSQNYLTVKSGQVLWHVPKFDDRVWVLSQGAQQGSAQTIGKQGDTQIFWKKEVLRHGRVQLFSIYHWDLLRCQNFGHGLRLVKKCCVEKDLQKNIGKTVSAAPKGKICCTDWRPKERSWAKMLGAGNVKIYVCVPCLFFWKMLPRLL